MEKISEEERYKILAAITKGYYGMWSIIPFLLHLNIKPANKLINETQPHEKTSFMRGCSKLSSFLNLNTTLLNIRFS